MAERFTTVRPRNKIYRGTGLGLMERGRLSREEMIAKFRKHYKKKLALAQRMVALTDEEIVVETHLNCTCPKHVEEVV